MSECFFKFNKKQLVPNGSHKHNVIPRSIQWLTTFGLHTVHPPKHYAKFSQSNRGESSKTFTNNKDAIWQHNIQRSSSYTTESQENKIMQKKNKFKKEKKGIFQHRKEDSAKGNQQEEKKAKDKLQVYIF